MHIKRSRCNQYFRALNLLNHDYSYLFFTNSCVEVANRIKVVLTPVMLSLGCSDMVQVRRPNDMDFAIKIKSDRSCSLWNA